MEAQYSPKKPEAVQARIPPRRGQVKVKIFRNLVSKIKNAASVVTRMGKKKGRGCS
jgi:hypothetical protein